MPRRAFLMADNATIAVSDGESTPVVHSFNPQKIDGKKAFYQNKEADIASGRESLTVSLSSSPKVRTVAIDLRVPKVVMETINGVNVYKIDSYATCKAQILVPIDWTAQECKNARTLLSNLLKASAIGLMSDENEFVW
jgi:hypothetical protein